MRVRGDGGGPGAAAARRAVAVAGLRLDARQLLFVEAVASGIPPAEAARSAGYVGDAYSALKSPSVRQAISLAVQEILQLEGAPVALNLLLQTIRNEGAPIKIRVDCAKAILDRAGHTARQRAPDSGPGKDLNEMSTEELKSLVDRLEGELAERAQPLDAPDETGVSPEVLDLLD